MSDDNFAELRPRDLAVVWGTAFGQLFQLWIAVSKSLLEAGGGEKDIPAGHRCRFPVSPDIRPGLKASNMRGESFDLPLDAEAVRFDDAGPADEGRVVVECTVDESRCGPIKGDIYRGEVVDARDRRVTRIALDAGS